MVTKYIISNAVNQSPWVEWREGLTYNCRSESVRTTPHIYNYIIYYYTHVQREKKRSTSRRVGTTVYYNIIHNNIIRYIPTSVYARAFPMYYYVI